MRFRTLGTTGFKVSEIGFGAWGIGGDRGGAMAYGPTRDGDSQKALMQAIDLGINFFDTSPLYGFGHSEELLGKTLKPFRKNVFFASKAGRLDFRGKTNYSWRSIQRSLAKSLKRLKTDYLDLFQLHDPSPSVLEKTDIIYDLFKLQQNGMIRAVGISVKSPDDALQILKKYPIPSIQVNFNLMDQRIRTNGVMALCRKKKVGLIIRTPLCFGFLTGDYKSTDSYERTDHRRLWSLQQRERWNEGAALFKARLGRKRKMSPAQSALNFCLSFKEVSTVIPGMLNTSQVIENCRASGHKPLSQTLLTTMLKAYTSKEFFIRPSK